MIARWWQFSMTRRASARRWIMGSLRSLKPPSRSAARRQHRREHGAPFSRRIALNETSHDHGRQRHAHDAGMVAGDAEQQDALRDAQPWGRVAAGFAGSLKGKCPTRRAWHGATNLWPAEARQGSRWAPRTGLQICGASAMTSDCADYGAKAPAARLALGNPKEFASMSSETYRHNAAE